MILRWEFFSNRTLHHNHPDIRHVERSPSTCPIMSYQAMAWRLEAKAHCFGNLGHIRLAEVQQQALSCGVFASQMARTGLQQADWPGPIRALPCPVVNGGRPGSRETRRQGDQAVLPGAKTFRSSSLKQNIYDMNRHMSDLPKAIASLSCASILALGKNQRRDAQDPSSGHKGCKQAQHPEHQRWNCQAKRDG